jgi:hypothetical protein
LDSSTQHEYQSNTNGHHTRTEEETRERLSQSQRLSYLIQVALYDLDLMRANQDDVDFIRWMARDPFVNYAIKQTVAQAGGDPYHFFKSLGLPVTPEFPFTAPDDEGGLSLVPLSTIIAEQMEWFWHPYVPLKKLTLIEGEPGLGKTFLVLMLVAAMTRGFCLPGPDGRVAPARPDTAGKAIYITAEDDLADTIRPRAERMGADLDQLLVPNPRKAAKFSLANPRSLEEAIVESQAKLVVLDPLSAFIGADVDAYRFNEVRPLMALIGDIARTHRCVIAMVRHWNKGRSGKAIQQGQGSQDFGAAVRSMLSVGHDPHDDRMRLMAQAKINVAAKGVTQRFTITPDGDFQWAGTSEVTADELATASRPGPNSTVRSNARQWLKDFLGTQARSAGDVFKAAEAMAFSERTLRRAKEDLGVLVAKEGEAWYWRLPKVQKWDRYADHGEDL